MKRSVCSASAGAFATSGRAVSDPAQLGDGEPQRRTRQRERGRGIGAWMRLHRAGRPEASPDAAGSRDAIREKLSRSVAAASASIRNRSRVVAARRRRADPQFPEAAEPRYATRRRRADSYRHTAAAAATFSDSSPPGCGMRSVSAQRRSSVAVDALPFVAEHPGAGPRQRRRRAATSPACELVASSGTRERVERVGVDAARPGRSAKCAPIAGAQHLRRPQRRGALRARSPARSRTPRRCAGCVPTLPASCSRSSTTRRRVGCAAPRRPATATTKPIGAGDSSVLRPRTARRARSRRASARAAPARAAPASSQPAR